MSIFVNLFILLLYLLEHVTNFFLTLLTDAETININITDYKFIYQSMPNGFMILEVMWSHLIMESYVV